MMSVVETGWEEGPPVHPGGRLLEWLEQHARTDAGKRRLFRLPVVIRFEDDYRLAIESVWIGRSEEDLQTDSVRLYLDDTGMSVGLLEQLGSFCTRRLRVCGVWLEGHWGRLVEIQALEVEQGATSKPFAVLRVVGPVLATEEDVRPSVRVEP